jgi:hypothetical protein
MVGLLIRSLVLMLITLGVSGATAPQSRCTNATLTGRYIFEGHGFIEPIEPGVERLHYGYFFFDGHGGLTGRQSSSRGGRIGREELAGTYALGADCAGTLNFHHVKRPGIESYGTDVETHWDIYVTGSGRKGHMIRTDPGTMAVRTFEK